MTSEEAASLMPCGPMVAGGHGVMVPTSHQHADRRQIERPIDLLDSVNRQRTMVLGHARTFGASADSSPNPPRRAERKRRAAGPNASRFWRRGGQTGFSAA